ncbi:DUF5810 domain-containing protein [Natronoglomus mannanivorans]|uniref:DUF5810 domain-containing protein n=1 Tax=Natronoglomus mannanivorans TaxID=2979990 RepID=A0AAP3E3N8_9EURY|nr:DUF5810 domain-containing protein [Halobacteria archaeon AArc-xg1-1]
MGYACPVCDEQQADAVHLANHLAITASIGRQDHLEWLEEYAPDWADCGPEELGEQVVEYALEVETPEFASESAESAGGHGHGHGHEHSHGKPSFENELARQTSQPGRGAAMSGDTGRILEEAREMTAQMYEDEEGSEGDGETENGDGESETERTDEAEAEATTEDENE